MIDRRVLAALLLCLEIGRSFPRAPALHRAYTNGCARRCTTSLMRDRFELELDLGPGAGVVQQELQALFSSSDLVTVRYKLPLYLSLAPELGQMRVTKSGKGLLVGDVLRACSTLQMKVENAFGLLPIGTRKYKCLFICDGQPSYKVIEALTANTEDVASEIVLVFERPRSF